MERSNQEIWEEIVRTAALIRGYEPTLSKLEKKLLFGELSEDAAVLPQLASDAQILAGLIEQLQRRGATFD